MKNVSVGLPQVESCGFFVGKSDVVCHLALVIDSLYKVLNS